MFWFGNRRDGSFQPVAPSPSRKASTPEPNKTPTTVTRGGSHAFFEPENSVPSADSLGYGPRFCDNSMQGDTSLEFSTTASTAIVRLSTSGSMQSGVSREPSIAQVPAPVFSADGSKIYLRFPIRDYIAECGLPIFIYKGKKPLLEDKELISSLRWPTIASLSILPLPRSLKVVQRYASYGVMSVQNKDYFETYDREYMEKKPPLRKEFERPLLLPCEDIAFFEDSDIELLSDLQNEAELCEMFQKFVLNTASAAAGMLRCLDPEDPAHRTMILKSTFRIYNNLFSDHYKKWNIFALAGPEPKSAPLIVIFIHPSDFGIEDFDRFVRERQFKHNELDHPTAPADIVWAVAYDALKAGKGHKFVVTNYVRWAFGMFEDRYETASVTNIYEAKLTDFEHNSISATPAQESSVMEMLIRWMETPMKKADIDRWRRYDHR